MQTNYSCEILTKTFKNKISKEAYLKATKWLAINVFSKPEIAENISVKIQKQEKAKIPTFVVTLFVNTDYDKMKEEYCEKCKHLHTIFYQVNKENCDECKMHGFIKTNESYSKGIIDFYKKIFEEDGNE